MSARLIPLTVVGISGGKRLRLLLGVVPLVFAMAAFWSGVDCTDRPGIPEAGLATQLYYSLGLYVLGGLDLGVPVGGDSFAHISLWIAYFWAPAITTAAVVETIVVSLNPLGLGRLFLRNHIVVAGGGRIASLYLQRLRLEQPRTTVILVDRFTAAAKLESLKHKFHVRVVPADITRPGLVTRLQMRRAQRLMLLTGDDFANLEMASRIADHADTAHLAPRTVVRIADPEMVRMLQDPAIMPWKIESLNLHTVVATDLVEQFLTERFEATQGQDVIVLSGFGRFGQTVLRELERRSTGLFDRVVLVDPVADRNWATYEDRARRRDAEWGTSFTADVIIGDQQDPLVWRRLRTKLADRAERTTFVIGTDDDAQNLRTALLVRDVFPEAYVACRMFDASAFALKMSREARIELVEMAERLQRTMQPSWFEKP